MRTRVWKWIAYLVFMAVLIGSANVGETQQAPIRGKIMDEEGALLSGVQIEVTTAASPDAIKGRTKKKGTFTIVLPQRSWEYEFRFTLDGYQELKLPILASRAVNEVLEITLARTQDTGAATRPAAGPVASNRNRRAGDDRAAAGCDPALQRRRHRARGRRHRSRLGHLSAGHRR
jgi:hypothetical protein